MNTANIKNKKYYALAMQSFGEETEESFRHEGEASFRSIDRTDSSRSQSSGGAEKKTEEVVKTDSETKKETQEVESKKLSEETGVSESTLKSSDKNSESPRNYPDVPGTCKTKYK